MIASKSGLTRDRFKYIWSNLCFGFTNGSDSDSGGETSDEEDDTPITLLRQTPPPPVESSEVDNEEPQNEDKLDDGECKKELWFDKISPLIDQIGKKLMRFMQASGFALSIDEMMVRFCARSSETHRMKNKLLNEGYKFFAIVNSKSGYVPYPLPDGRLASKRTASGNAKYK